MGRRILFLGPPGAGKGTQSAMLATAIGIPHISTGEMLRGAISEGSELGRQVEAVVSSGALVSDDLVLAIVEDRLSKDDATCGYLLDGFPRNVAQAVALAAVVGNGGVEVAVLIDVDTDELVARLINRAEREGRSDDTEEVIRHRLEVYRSETAPLVEHYSDRLVTVDGAGEVDDVFARIVRALVR
jgi:adenylate kinase